VFPAIPKIVLIEQLGLLARTKAARLTVRASSASHCPTMPDHHRHATTNKLLQVRALPPHHALEDAVELHQCAITRDLHRRQIGAYFPSG